MNNIIKTQRNFYLFDMKRDFLRLIAVLTGTVRRSSRRSPEGAQCLPSAHRTVRTYPYTALHVTFIHCRIKPIKKDG